MKRKVIGIILSILLLVGCVESEPKITPSQITPAPQMEANFIVKVSGTSGLRFSGSCATTTISGTAISKSLDGVVPAEYTISGAIVSCAFQKQSAEGVLKVEIIKDGKVVAQSDTSATYGVVSVATS